MKLSRFSLASFLALAVIALAQQATPQAPQVNGATQVKNIPASTTGTGDHWLHYVPTGAVNGTNNVFTIPVAAREMRVMLNGVEQFVVAELPTGANANIAMAVGTGVTTVSFLSPVPQPGDAVVIEATQ